MTCEAITGYADFEKGKQNNCNTSINKYAMTKKWQNKKIPQQESKTDQSSLSFFHLQAAILPDFITA